MNPNSPTDDDSFDDGALRDAFASRRSHVDRTVEPHLAYRDFNEAGSLGRAWYQTPTFARFAVPASVAAVALVVVGFFALGNGPNSTENVAVEPTPSAEITPEPTIEPTVAPETETPTAAPDAPTSEPVETPTQEPAVDNPTPIPPTPAPETPAPSTPEAPTPEPETPTETPTEAPALTNCSAARYSVNIPAGWFTNDASTSPNLAQCSLFSPAPIVIPGETEFVIEVGIYVTTEESYTDALNRYSSNPNVWIVQSSTTTTVDGQPAQILDITLGNDAMNGGGRQTIYIVDIGDGVLIATANEITDNSQAPQNYPLAISGLQSIMSSIGLVVNTPPPTCPTPPPPATWDQALGAIVNVDFNADGTDEIIVPIETSASGTNYGIFRADTAACTYVQMDGVTKNASAANVSDFGCRPGPNGTIELLRYFSSINNNAATTIFGADMSVEQMLGGEMVAVETFNGTNDTPAPPADFPVLQNC